jgi:hypothetical protein
MFLLSIIEEGWRAQSRHLTKAVAALVSVLAINRIKV